MTAWWHLWGTEMSQSGADSMAAPKGGSDLGAAQCAVWFLPQSSQPCLGLGAQLSHLWDTAGPSWGTWIRDGPVTSQLGLSALLHLIYKVHFAAPLCPTHRRLQAAWWLFILKRFQENKALPCGTASSRHGAEAQTYGCCQNPTCTWLGDQNILPEM